MAEADMPWTRKQVRFLLSKVSPLSESEKTNMKAELHENPEMGHKPRGSRRSDVISALGKSLRRKK